MANISTDFSTWSGTAGSNQPDSGDTATVQADLQAIQAALRTIFPSVNAAVTPTHTELNYVDGVTSAIQTQLNAKAGLVSPSFTTPVLGTPTSGTLTNCTGLPLTTGVTGTLADDNGGTGQSTYSAGDILYASGANTLAKRAVGSTGDVLTVSGGVPTWAAPSGLTSGTVIATTSGTSHDFTSIPSTVKRITLSLAGVSTSGTSAIQVQLGDSGGIENTGYLGAYTAIGSGSGSTANLTSGFGLITPAAASVLHGAVVLTLLDAATFTWACSATGALSNVANTFWGAGSKSLSATLTQIRLTTVNGTDTFDAGQFNIIYE